MIPNHTWALDFMSDCLYHGRCFRTLNVLDEGCREGLAIFVSTSIPSARVIRVLKNLSAWRKPHHGDSLRQRTGVHGW